MTADWLRPGTVELKEDGGALYVRVRGNLHRDLEGAARDGLVAELKRAAKRSRLLLDLRDIVRIDSWGEEVLVDVIEDVVGASGRVAVLTDKARPHLLRGLTKLLKKYEKTVAHVTDEAPAQSWVAEAKS